MIHFVSKITQLDYDNLVCLIEKKEDISLLDFLELPKNIHARILQEFNDKTSEVLEFFLGQKKNKKTLYLSE